MNTCENLIAWKLRPDASMPVRSTQEAAGYDIRFCPVEQTPEGIILPSPGMIAQVDGNMVPLLTVVKCPTGIALRIPDGHYGRLAPRSGLGSKGVHVMAGVIDRDFRGEVCALLVNLGPTPLRIMPGERMVQLILERCSTPDVEEGDINEMDNTSRGTGGFGSTGKG